MFITEGLFDNAIPKASNFFSSVSEMHNFIAKYVHKDKKSNKQNILLEVDLQSSSFDYIFDILIKMTFINLLNAISWHN